MNKKTLELRTLILTAIVLTLTIVSIIGMIIFFNKVTSEKQANFILMFVYLLLHRYSLQ